MSGEFEDITRYLERGKLNDNVKSIGSKELTEMEIEKKVEEAVEDLTSNTIDVLPLKTFWYGKDRIYGFKILFGSAERKVFDVVSEEDVLGLLKKYFPRVLDAYKRGGIATKRIVVRLKMFINGRIEELKQGFDPEADFKKLLDSGKESTGKLETLVADCLKRKYFIGLNGGDLYYYDLETGVYRPLSDRIVGKESEELGEKYGFRDRVNNRFVEEVYGKLKRICVEIKERDEKHLLFENGLVDVEEALETGVVELKEPTPEVFVKTKIPISLGDGKLNLLLAEKRRRGEKIDYLALLKEYAPSLYRVIMDWADGNRERALCMLETIGYLLVPGNPLKKLFILYGGPNTGKTTFLALLMRIVGAENVVVKNPADLDERFALADFPGKRLWIFDDIPSTRKIRSSVIKMVTGESTLVAERKYKDPVYFKPSVKPVFSCNKLPDVDEMDEAFIDRVVLLKFQHVFGKSRDAKRKILENPEVCNLALIAFYAAIDAVRREGFTEVDNDLKEKWEKEKKRVQSLRHIDGESKSESKNNDGKNPITQNFSSTMEHSQQYNNRGDRIFSDRISYPESINESGENGEIFNEPTMDSEKILTPRGEDFSGNNFPGEDFLGSDKITPSGSEKILSKNPITFTHLPPESEDFLGLYTEGKDLEKQAILKLALQGWSPRRISERLGVSRSYVYNVISRARKRGLKIPKFRPGRPRSKEVKKDD